MTPRPPLPDWLRIADGDLWVAVHVVPGASRSRVLGPHGDRLRVAVAAPPERGRANDELIALLAGLLGMPRRQLTVARGATSRRKDVRVGPLVADAPAEPVADAASRLVSAVDGAGDPSGGRWRSGGRRLEGRSPGAG